MGDIERCECCEQPLTAEGQAHAQEVVMRLRAEANAGTIRDLQHQLWGAVDALEFTRRTLDDPDLDEAEALMRIGGVVRRTLDQLGGQ